MDMIVIVGGGAGGLELATRLGDTAGKAGRARIVLVDRSPGHFWKPLLHTVASGARDPQVSQIAFSAQAAEHHFEFVQGDVVAVDRSARSIELAPRCVDGEEVQPRRTLAYDKLVLALGSVTNFYGVPGVADHSLTLDNVAQAETFRRRFVNACIQAAEHKKLWPYKYRIGEVHVAIVGGGATGVELAAELHHSARTLARYKVAALDPMRDIRISIIERGPYLLPHLKPRQSRHAANHLRSMGVEVLTSTTVASVAPRSVHVLNEEVGHELRADLTLWAAGVEAPRLCATLGLSTNRQNQILVDSSLRTQSDANVYAFGDCASYDCPVRGVVPPRAQVAHQQALFLAELLARPAGAAGKKEAAFQYRDYGSLVSLGPTKAVGMLQGALSNRSIPVAGLTARMLYALMYQKHMLALHGMLRMSLQSVSDWLRARLSPPVRLH